MNLQLIINLQQQIEIVCGPIRLEVFVLLVTASRNGLALYKDVRVQTHTALDS